jgi:hypothetical protein
MTRLATALFILLFSAVALRADLVLQQQTSEPNGAETNDAETVVIKVHGHQMRLDEPKEYFSVIVDLDTHDSITLFTNIKKYLKRSGAEIQQKLAADKLAAHGTNDAFAPAAPPVDTGRARIVAGYQTKIYTWTGAQGLTEALWVATNFPSYEAIRPELAKLDRFNAAGPHPNAQPELSRLPGMVVKNLANFHGHERATTLVSARMDPVDPSVFELPAGYSVWTPK